MTKWKLVPVKALEELRNSVSGRVNMGSVWEAAVIDSMLEAAPQPPKLSDERILHHLDAILKASGSGLKNYSMHKTIEDMKQAVRAIEREILGDGHE
jgi:hypothetical protein